MSKSGSNPLTRNVMALFVALALYTSVTAQPPGWENHPLGGPPPHSRPCWPPPCVSVDNYIFVIVIGAVALAGFFYKREIE